MKSFTVKHNFSVFRPAWGGDYVRIFGKDNEGFILEAENMEHAKEVIKKEQNLNPFYLTITETN